MMFRVGQKVVCLDQRGSACLRDNQVYTCLAIEPEFLGVDCCDRSNSKAHRWFKGRFRPIVERKTDISIFTEMLTKVDA